MKKSFWQNKIILITGANGFLGSSFLAYFQAKNIKAIGVDLKADKNRSVFKLDILQEKKLAVLCAKQKINLIIHCAALDGNAEFKKNNADLILKQNVLMTANVLKVAKSNNINELLIFSSAEIYPNKIGKAFRESDDYTKHKIKTDAYAAAKINSEIMANISAQQFGLKILLIRPTNVYGPNDKKPLSSSRVIPSVVKKVLHDQEVEIWGDGQQKKDFIYIDDLIVAAVSLLEINFFSTVNIASGEKISISDLAKKIAVLSKKELKIKFNHSQPSGGTRIISTARLNKLINFKPTKLDVGLKKTIAYYRNQHE